MDFFFVPTHKHELSQIPNTLGHKIILQLLGLMAIMCCHHWIGRIWNWES